MKHKNLSRLLWVPIVLLHVAFLQSAEAQPNAKDAENVTLYDYVIQSGDSCAGVAERELGSRKGYRTIHKYNDLGPLPHKLKAGEILRLPKATRTPDAILESRVGNVEYRKAAETIWGNAAKGMDIFRSWRVWSHKKSTAVLIFKDDSILSLRDDTVVVIYGPTSADGKRKLVRAELETGSLRSRLAALESKLLVDTPSSSIELENGSSVITASGESKRSTVSNHEGGSVAVRQRKKRGRRAPAVKVAAGKGTWIDAGKAPAPPRDLPSAPELRKAPELQIALAATGVVLIGSWKPVIGAERYRVEVATDPNVRIVVAAFEVTKDVTSFEAQGLKPGRYYVSVATIDDKGLESAPSPRMPTEIALLEHKSLDASPAANIAQGSQLMAPDALKCTIGEAAPSSSVALLVAGPTTVRCTGKDGVQSAPLSLEVSGSQLELSGGSDGAAKVVEGEVSEILLTSNPALPASAKLRLETDAGVHATVKSIGPEGIRLSIEATSDSGSTSSIRVFRSTTGGEFLLSQVALDIQSLEAPEEIKPDETQPRIAIGVLAGMYLSDLEDDGPEPNEAPFIGARASVEISGRLELDLETNLSRRAADEPYLFASNQIQFAWRQPVGASFFLRGRAGLALWHNNVPDSAETTAIGMAAGVGIERTIGPGGLRLDVGAFAFAEASKRLQGSISYQWEVDLLD